MHVEDPEDLIRESIAAFNAGDLEGSHATCTRTMSSSFQDPVRRSCPVVLR